MSQGGINTGASLFKKKTEMNNHPWSKSEVSTPENEHAKNISVAFADYLAHNNYEQNVVGGRVEWNETEDPYIHGEDSPEILTSHQVFLKFAESNPVLFGIRDATVGAILTGAVKLHKLENLTFVESVIGLPEGVLLKLMNDEYYTNSVPVVTFMRLLQSLTITFSKIEPVMMPTFKLLLSKERPETIRAKPPHYQLWENEESVTKYTKRLGELMSKQIS